MTRPLLFEHIDSALHSLRLTRMRTLLTTLGVAIGIASITAILALSAGINQIIDRQVTDLKGNIGVIRPGAPETDSNFLANPTIDRSYTASTLTEADLQDIIDTPGIEAAAPLMLVNGSMSASKQTVTNGKILATTPELKDIANLPVRDGQFIDSVTNSNTTVIGSQLSVDLFGTDQAIGQTLKIRGQTFTVIGILKPIKSPINYNNVDFDRTAIISLVSGKNFHHGVAEIQQIDVKASSEAGLKQAIPVFEDALAKNHTGERDFTTLSGEAIAQPSNRFFIALAGVMTTIAAISLVVGGVGIMNIMLVSVAERTREIGLRKAVGASTSTIVWQFLVEALIISLLGGVLGYVAGYLLAFSVSSFFTFAPAFTWHIAGIALGLSLGVGVLFGIYPAVRAARKDPIESLRHYR